jgi:chromate transporter
MIYLQILGEFLKIGLFAIGGPSTMPFLFDLAERHAWFSTAELADMITLAQTAPGPFGVNVVALAGFHSAGLTGALLATLGFVLPPTLISLLICRFLVAWRDNQYVEMAFSGLRPATAGLLAAVCLSLLALALCSTDSLFTATSLNLKALLFFLVVTPLIFRFKINPLVFIALGALVGIVANL